jgi:outer membrane lipoprotein-sorting protein
MTLRFPAAVLAAALLVGIAAPPALAQTGTIALSRHDLGLVNQATAYLQGLQEVEGRFEQTNPRGVVTQGDIFLRRPGKARFQYDAPSGLVVVSDGKNVSVYDSRLKTFDRTPLGATPLAILLARKVQLDQDVEVTRVGTYDDGFYLSARNANGQAQTEGYITMVFGSNPMVLRGWTLVDGQGQATRVKITDLKPQAIDPALFVLNDPRTPAERGEKPKAAKPKPEKPQSDQGAKTTSD